MSEIQTACYWLQHCCFFDSHLTCTCAESVIIIINFRRASSAESVSIFYLFLVMHSITQTEFNIFLPTQACAECFMSVSTASPAMTRKNQLSQCFVSLLCDKSRWVCNQKLHFCVLFHCVARKSCWSLILWICAIFLWEYERLFF